MRKLWGGLALLSRLIVGHLRTPKNTQTVAQRLAALPLANAPLQAPIRLYWNDHLVPYIDADSEGDLAVGLGLVHGHLRLAQLELLRYVSQGRLSEVFGALANGVDHTLRILDFGRGGKASLAAMPARDQAWLQGFCDGLNHIVGHVAADPRRWPDELRILKLTPQSWSCQELMALGRLSGADSSWGVWMRLLPMRTRKDWLQVWRHLMQHSGGPPIPTPGKQPDLQWLAGLFAKPGGSNAVAVSPQRSATGSAQLSGDPHLPVVLPGFWLLAGLHCPTLKAVGYMLPGFPAVMVGRSPAIAWGGTSMHAASSDLFDVSDLAADQITQRQEVLTTRWGRAKTITVNETRVGPIISDAPRFPVGPGERLAMRWVGHQPSNELGALLGVARATDFDQFSTALSTFGVSPQNMVYADRHGNIGQLMAAILPARPAQRPADLVLPLAAADTWSRRVNCLALPREHNPPAGFVASANNRPTQAPDVLVSCFFSPEDRVNRLRQVLSGQQLIDKATLLSLHTDVYSPSAIALRDRWLPLIDAGQQPEVTRALAEWDGNYDLASQGALAFEFCLYHFAKALHSEQELAIYTANWDPRSLLLADFDAAPEHTLRRALATALGLTHRALIKYRSWQAVHRVRFCHPFAALPLLGRRWRFGERGIAGANETLMKSAHGFARGVHHVGMSSTARYYFDLADEDSSCFLLLGGQDGHPGSSAFTDQLNLWDTPELINLPLRLATVKARFPHRCVCHPPRVTT